MGGLQNFEGSEFVLRNRSQAKGKEQQMNPCSEHKHQKTYCPYCVIEYFKLTEIKNKEKTVHTTYENEIS